ncbi:hypothetical protein V5O48_013041 [Marasmius crinis-equi]|uniref:Uncharacterized protein n=1 Tax=Marasmius crinis-equi TaxID=585013 RepID=A0ABR3F1B7_9AGAR
MPYLPPSQPGESAAAFVVRALSPFRYESEAVFNKQCTCTHGDGPHRLEVRLEGSDPHRFGEQYLVCPYELCGNLPPPRRLEADVLDLVSFLYSLFRKFQVAHEDHVTTINTYNATMEARVHPHDFMVYWFSRLLFLHRKEELSVVYQDAKDQLGRFYRRENGEPMSKDDRRAFKSALFLAWLPELEAHGREIGDHMLDIPRGDPAPAAPSTSVPLSVPPVPSTSAPPPAQPGPSTSTPPPAQAVPPTPVCAPAQTVPSTPPSVPPAQAAMTSSEDTNSPTRNKRKLSDVLDELDSQISPGKRARDAIIAEALRTREPRKPAPFPMPLPPVVGPSTGTSSSTATQPSTTTNTTATVSTPSTTTTAGTVTMPPAATDSTVAPASVNPPFPDNAEYIVISDTDD